MRVHAWDNEHRCIECGLMFQVRTPQHCSGKLGDWGSTPIGLNGSKILLASGNYFDFLDMDPDAIEIEDISKSLSSLNRFTGHGGPYSVAEHSVLCYRLSKVTNPDDPSLWFAALMHDAAESILGDVSTPLKQLLPRYLELEEELEGIIATKFGILSEHKPAVKIIDRLLLKAEVKHLFPGAVPWEGLDGYAYHDIDFKRWRPKKAARKFMKAYRKCTEKI